MNNTNHSRRQFLAAGGLGAAASLAAVATPSGAAQAAAAAPPTASSGVMTRESYLQYVDWFNHNDRRFLTFYHPDVVLELGNTTLKGANAIGDFYAEVKAHIHETVTVNHFVADATGVAVEIPTEFRVYKDWPEPNYFRRALKTGEVYRVISFGLYWVDGGKFRQIKAARYKLVNDWKMEG